MALSPSETPASEAELIDQAQTGDRRAFSELVRAHRPGVVNVVYRLCGDASLAEDSAQETFIRAWEHLNSFHPSADPGNMGFRNWLYRIATRSALTELRRQRPTVAVDDLALADQERGPEQRVEQAQRAEAVRQAVLALPEASRQALVLREYEGLSYRDIAAVLDIPVGTVMSRLNYARQQLRERLAPFLEAE